MTAEKMLRAIGFDKDYEDDEDIHFENRKEKIIMIFLKDDVEVCLITSSEEDNIFKNNVTLNESMIKAIRKQIKEIKKEKRINKMLKKVGLKRDDGRRNV